MHDASKESGREGRVFCMRTTDGGKTWKLVSWIGPEPEGFSIMSSSVRLSPSRILTAIRLTWGEEINLRGDGGWWDLGYPRTVQRPDGKIVTVYYFNDHKDTERYIAATFGARE